MGRLHIEMGTPEAEPVTVDDAKTHLRVSHAEDDDYIGNLIAAAREWGESFQGRSWIVRSIDLYLDDWPQSPLALPRGPVQDVSSVTFYTQDGGEETLDSGTYWLDPAGRFNLTAGKVWPCDPLRESAGVKITYTAGYGDTAADVPRRCRQAVLLMVGHWYENREEVVIGSRLVAQIPVAAEALLYQERVMPL